MKSVTVVFHRDQGSVVTDTLEGDAGYDLSQTLLRFWGGGRTLVVPMNRLIYADIDD